MFRASSFVVGVNMKYDLRDVYKLMLQKVLKKGD